MAETTLTATASSNNWRSGGSWPPPNHVGNEDSGNTFFVNHERDGGTYWAANGYVRFDGSSIPGGTITAATLRLYVGNFYQSKMDADNMSLAGEYYDYGGTTDSGDYAANVTSPCFTAIDITGITVGQYLEIPLTVLGGINTSGFFGFRLTFVPSGAPAGFNQLGFHSVPNSTGKPQLVVTTSDGGETTPVSSTRGSRWHTRAHATSARGTRWHVLAHATSTRGSSWDVRDRAMSSRGTSWHTLICVDSTRGTSWHLRAIVARTHGTSWSVLAAVTTTRGTSWHVYGAGGPPDPPGMVAVIVRVHPAVAPHSTVTVRVHPAVTSHSTVTVPVGSQTRATTRARGVTTHG